MGEYTNRQVIAAWSRAWSAPARADEFGEEGDFGRRHLLNPTLFAMLGDVRGRRVLDAGCGQGYLCRLLARRGAIVTGVEPAGSLYHYAVGREATDRLGITYLQADLSEFTGPVPRFDAVVANMVLMGIPDYEAAMASCVAALRPGGRLVVSLQHPCFEESAAAWTKGYVEVSEYLHDYIIDRGDVPNFHRPLSRYINLFVRLGCVIGELAEPQLPADLATGDPAHERNVHVPSFLAISATKT
ncbi:MAG: class I SAM-dependent methyltransferase [Dehalococcoidia bacterium]